MFKKVISLTVLFGLFAHCIHPTTYQVYAASTANAALQLPFDGNATDISIAQVSTTAMNKPGYEQGRLGQAIRFTASGQYVDLGNTASTSFGDTTDFSLSFWLKTAGSASDPVIIGNKDWNSGANPGWAVALQQDGSLKWNYPPASKTRIDATIPDVADNQWHHIVIANDRDGFTTMYKDGQLAATANISTQQGNIDTTYTTKIGQDGTGTYKATLDATLDELKIYKSNLSAAEVLSEYEAGKPTPVVNLPMDGNWNDLASNVQATAEGNPSFIQGKSDQAIQFSAAGQYVDLGSTASTAMGDNTDFTVAYWIKTAGSAGDPVIIGNKDWASGANTGWVMAMQGNGSIKWNYTPEGQTRADAYIPNIADDQWLRNNLTRPLAQARSHIGQILTPI